MIRSEIFEKMMDALHAGVTAIHNARLFLNTDDEYLDYYQEARLVSVLEVAKTRIQEIEKRMHQRSPSKIVSADVQPLKCDFCGAHDQPLTPFGEGERPLICHKCRGDLFAAGNG